MSEWEDVYIIGTEEFPHPRAKSDRQKQQERHLMYVGVTRAIKNLYFVGVPFSCLNVPGYDPDQQGLTIVSYPAADHLEIHSVAEPSVYDALGFEKYDPTVADALFHDFLEESRSPSNKDLGEGLQTEVVEERAFSGIDAFSDKDQIVEVLEQGRISRVIAIEVLCPTCNNTCLDLRTGSLTITPDLVGHTIVCSVCRKGCIVPLNAFSLQGEVVACEKPVLGVTNSQREKKGRTKKERKSTKGRKTKSGTVREPMQLSLDIRTIQTLNAMGVNKSQLFEELLKQYEPFLDAWSELGNDFSEEDDDELDHDEIED